MTDRILLTGSTGFLGSALLSEVEKRPDFSLMCAVRRLTPDMNSHAFEVGDINGQTDYSDPLANVDVVIHSAARAHIMEDEVADPLVEYRKVNVAGSENLARQAAMAGVKRFIYISSIKVIGEGTNGECAYKESTQCIPEDDYGQSKHEAEEVIKKVARETGMELVIIRPPLIYGPGVKANFRSLLKLSKLPAPLPFGLIRNKRSMVYTGNIVDFIVRCVNHPGAANQTFLVSDGQDLSLPELIRIIRKIMNRPAWLLPVPVWLLKLTGRLTGKTAIVDRLVGDLQVDSSKAQQLLDWKPPYTVEDGIEETVAEFVNRKT